MAKRESLSGTEARECEELKRIYEDRKQELNLSQGAIANVLNISQGAVSHYLNGINPLNAAVASVFARLLRVGVGEFSERLEREIIDMAKGVSSTLEPISGDSKDTTTLRQFDIRASCGNGALNPDFPELIRTIEVPNDKIFQLFGKQDLTGIYLISPDGDSMKYTIPVKSLVFVDSRVNSFTGDGIYVFVLNGHTYMKRLQRCPDNSLEIISDNRAYKSFNIKPANEDFFIAARYMCNLPLEMMYG